MGLRGRKPRWLAWKILFLFLPQLYRKTLDAEGGTWELEIWLSWFGFGFLSVLLCPMVLRDHPGNKASALRAVEGTATFPGEAAARIDAGTLSQGHPPSALGGAHLP